MSSISALAMRSFSSSRFFQVVTRALPHKLHLLQNDIQRVLVHDDGELLLQLGQQFTRRQRFLCRPRAQLFSMHCTQLRWRSTAVFVSQPGETLFQPVLSPVIYRVKV